MIDSILSLAATVVNTYVLYMLYLRHGFPDMFSSVNGLVTAGLLAASATYFIISVMPSRQYVEEAGDLEDDVEADKVWHEISKPYQGTYTPPDPSSVTPQPVNNGDSRDDLLSKAIAAAIAKAELKGRINIDVDIPEHEIAIGGHKASVRGVMSLTTTPERKTEVRETPQYVPPPATAAPPENPVDFIKRKLEEMRGGE